MGVVNRVFDKGLKGMRESVQAELQAINARLEQLQHRLDAHIDDYGGFEKRVTSDVQTSAELFLTIQHSLDRLNQEIEDLKSRAPSP